MFCYLLHQHLNIGFTIVNLQYFGNIFFCFVLYYLSVGTMYNDKNIIINTKATWSSNSNVSWSYSSSILKCCFNEKIMQCMISPSLTTTTNCINDIMLTMLHRNVHLTFVVHLIHHSCLHCQENRARLGKKKKTEFLMNIGTKHNEKAKINSNFLYNTIN